MYKRSRSNNLIKKSRIYLVQIVVLYRQKLINGLEGRRGRNCQQWKGHLKAQMYLFQYWVAFWLVSARNAVLEVPAKWLVSNHL